MAASRRSPTAPALRRLPALALVLATAGCAGPVSFDSALASLTSPFSGPRNTVASDSLTAQRIRGGNPEVAPLLPEPGNVWPEQEAPRPTLLSGPEEAMRNIPEYRPSLIPDPASPASSPVRSGETPRARRGSSTAPDAPLPATDPARAGVLPQPGSTAGAGIRPEGQVTLSPSGQPAITTGQAGRVRGVTQPGVGGGAVIRDGNVETWIGPDGQARTRVVPP